MFLIVPITMLTLPYLMDASYEEYGLSFFRMLTEGGGLRILGLIWLLGAVAGLAVHCFNPLREDENREIRDTRK